MIKSTQDLLHQLFSAIGSGVFGNILYLLSRENVSMFTGWQIVRFSIVGLMVAVLSYFGVLSYFDDKLYALLSGVFSGFAGFWLVMGMGKIVQDWGVKPFSTASKITDMISNWRKK